eukprot:6179593-Pleurochrysis_carterae.AAC.2
MRQVGTESNDTRDEAKYSSRKERTASASDHNACPRMRRTTQIHLTTASPPPSRLAVILSPFEIFFLACNPRTVLLVPKHHSCIRVRSPRFVPQSGYLKCRLSHKACEVDQLQLWLAKLFLLYLIQVAANKPSRRAGDRQRVVCDQTCGSNTLLAMQMQTHLMKAASVKIDESKCDPEKSASLALAPASKKCEGVR